MIVLPLELLPGVVEELLLGEADDPLIVLLDELGDVLDVEPLMLLLFVELLLPESDVSLLLEVDPLRVPEPEIDVLDDGDVVVVLLVEGELEIVVSVVVEPVVLLTLLSGMQSWCTGLRECSFASPVSLSASLPAFG
ncbi:MAG TPA: hypothetical protein VFP36_00815 [Usitatibacter sp.]|nr:hypothetical protein [Usitatibacter sp.]